MVFYKHYSFDLWLTLIKSNPAFKIERAKYFHARYNSVNKTLDEVALTFRQVDLMVNAINEKTGKNIDADEMYIMVISLINDFSTAFQDINLNELYTEMEKLLLTHLPVIYCSECVDTLRKLKRSGASTISVLSNTGFIKGQTLRKIVGILGLTEVLDFQLYSDEVRMSKPNPEFFRLMLNTIDRNKHPQIALHEIIHVGDNPVADIKGAQAIGIKSLLINSNGVSILHLLL